MEVKRKSFVLYKDWINDIKNLPDRQVGELFMAILEFVNGELPVVSKANKLLYDKYTKSIEADWAKFNPKTKKYHWNYKGGISPENKIIRNSSKMYEWRIAVFERDEYTCQVCGIIGGELNAHYIKEFSKYPELRFELSNGMTVCKTCHIQIHKMKTDAK